MKRINNLPYDISIAVFEYISLGDSSQIKKMVSSSVAIGRFEILSILFEYLLDENISAFRESDSETVQNFMQQSKVFLGTLSTLVMLRGDDEEIEFYSPKSRAPCLCKVGAAILREEAPNFYRNPRSLYEFINMRYLLTPHGKANIEKSEKLSPQLKSQQFARLLEKYNVIKKVRDFDGVQWVEC
ncbi:MAG: hypothetical protein R3F26_06655 [Gammaproteobacteria bacterium]